jgi:hypothetical protein
MRPVPTGSQVRVDLGPMSLGCVQGPDPDCLIVELVGSDKGSRFNVGELASAADLGPGHRMRIMAWPSYADRVLRRSYLGGFDGTRATKVVLTLVDGSTVDAQVDAGTVSRGDTLFWAAVDERVTKVTALDAEGNVVRSQAVRPCDLTNTCG